MKKCAHWFLGVLFPNRCRFCSAELHEGACVCPGCLGSLELIGSPACGRCGAPLSLRTARSRAGARARRAGPAEGPGCVQCADMDLVFRRNVSLGVYSGAMRELIHLYKFERRRSLHALFGRLVAERQRDYILGHDLLVPVPLTRDRLVERGYNQSGLVARWLSERVPVRFRGEVLARRGTSKPQSGVPSRAERLSNLTDLFAVKRASKGEVSGKTVLLFDDVLTTGATASLCARALYDAGARAVDLLTLARALVEA